MKASARRFSVLVPVFATLGLVAHCGDGDPAGTPGGPGEDGGAVLPDGSKVPPDSAPPDPPAGDAAPDATASDAGDGGALDPACQGVTCTTPPAAFCVDATTRRSFEPKGTCLAGQCSYPRATDKRCLEVYESESQIRLLV